MQNRSGSDRVESTAWASNGKQNRGAAAPGRIRVADLTQSLPLPVLIYSSVMVACIAHWDRQGCLSYFPRIFC